MTREEASELLTCGDLFQIAASAYNLRSTLHPGHIVTYSTEEDASAAVAIRSLDEALDRLDEVDDETVCVAPVCSPPLTAVEYLKLVAVCRLYVKAPHVQVTHNSSGLKVGQIALRFGADDFGRVQPGSVSEEEVRRVIRDAGFIPKRRDAAFRTLFLL